MSSDSPFGQSAAKSASELEQERLLKERNAQRLKEVEKQQADFGEKNNHRHPLLYISPQISPYSPNLSKKKQLSPNRLEKSTENIYLCYLKLNNKYHSSFNHKTAKRKR